jgi:hypothetical protein
MLRALLKFTEVSRPAAPAVTLASDPIEGNALFEALVCEFHWAALQIGAIAGCMNAGVALRRSWMLRSCRNLVPVESPVVRVALRSWQDVGYPREIAAAIGGVYFELSDAKKLTLPLISYAGVFVGPQIPFAKLEQISAVWRKLADDCNAAVQELEPETRWRLNGLYTANALVLGKFLKEVMAGSYACVNQYGEVALPILPQRRKTPRFMLLQPCKITSQGCTSMAFARDVSKNGIGLNCERDFRLKDAVVVELRNGRKLKGIVVWRQKGRIGVRFDYGLADDDPLISA